MNVFVEYKDYQKVSMGWVQAKEMERRLRTKELYKPVQTKNLFHVEEKPGEIHDITGVRIDKIHPSNFEVGPDWAVNLFVVIAKAWEGLWEALVFYLAILVVYAERQLLFSKESEEIRTPPMAASASAGQGGPPNTS